MILSFILMMSSCKSSKKVTKEKTIDVPVVIVEGKGKEKEKVPALEKRIIEEALSWLGTPYKYGASEKGKETDCSGMVLKVYEIVTEIKLPRNSKKQAEFCKELESEKVKAGDLVFFATGNDNEISHVGIMIDQKDFIHASASKGVIISEMTTPYYIRKFKMYGRVPGM